jgi:hypothetical protein
MTRYYRTEGVRMVELAPSRCPAGHPFGPEKVLVGTQPCLCAGLAHRTWQCVRCSAVLVWPACVHNPNWVEWDGDP